MPIEFDVKLEAKDMYRFNMYHTYHGFQGWLSIILGIAITTLSIYTFGQIEIMYTVLYILFGIIFVIYNPVSLFISSKKVVVKSDTLKHTLHYSLSEEGLTIRVQDAFASLQWNQIFRALSTKKNLLIYTSRRNAYVIPKRFIKNEYESTRLLLKQQLPSYRFHVKK
jgi:hypothetical protein